MSAKDVAIIAQHVVKEYPEILDITKKTEADFDGASTNSKPSTICSSDSLVTVKRSGWPKTGTTDLAGASFSWPTQMKVA